MSADDRTGELMKAVQADDVASVVRLLKESAIAASRVNDPIGPFDSPPPQQRPQPGNDRRSCSMPGPTSTPRAGGGRAASACCTLASPELAAYAVERGAEVDIHAACPPGAHRPGPRAGGAAIRRSVHARGGDGQTPLHFAKTVEIAAYLLDHGADIDAKDVDHESTPAQYMLGDRPEVARYLVERGCRTDILLASAVGDIDRVRSLLDADPGCLASAAMSGSSRWRTRRRAASSTSGLWARTPRPTRRRRSSAIKT